MVPHPTPKRQTQVPSDSKSSRSPVSNLRWSKTRHTKMRRGPSDALRLKPCHIFARWIGVLSLHLLGILVFPGCSLVPIVREKPQLHNPFPQLSRVAIVPFANQSNEPTLSGARVAEAYYHELQSIPGFEVVPIGVVESQLPQFEQMALGHPIQTSEDFQKFAQFLGVDAVLQGSITEYDPYYPPRMTLKVNWYAANPGFHPIPVGYGLPWGTKAEKDIPAWIRLESERELAAAQLATQTPVPTEQYAIQPATANQSPPPISSAEAQPGNAPESLPESSASQSSAVHSSGETNENFASLAHHNGSTIENDRIRIPMPEDVAESNSGIDLASQEIILGEEIPAEGHPTGIQLRPDSVGLIVTPVNGTAMTSSVGNIRDLPIDWPDPQGLIPASPSANRPRMVPQIAPIISHMNAYNGHDEDFTEKLSEYFYFRDDARFGGWRAYLQRSEDFIRFCCHLHVVETLASRGGQLESRMIFRWPINR